MNGDTITRLENWYRRHCNDEWENDYGVSIESTDNPGWWVKIDLDGTELEHASFTEVTRGDGACLNPTPPWMHCYVDEKHVFNGGGDPTKLGDILDAFLQWADSHAKASD